LEGPADALVEVSADFHSCLCVDSYFLCAQQCTCRTFYRFGVVMY
jgi:hypothetical protein